MRNRLAAGDTNAGKKKGEIEQLLKVEETEISE